jgi:ribonuclease HII
MTGLDAVYPGYGFAGHKGYGTPEHQQAIRELGPCAIHRRSFDYIRELCGLYSPLFYALKKDGAAIERRPELSAWEKSLQSARPQLSEMENKKLQQMARRLWKRVSG